MGLGERGPPDPKAQVGGKGGQAGAAERGVLVLRAGLVGGAGRF